MPQETEILENLGLTGAEIKTYLGVLELGSSTAGPIVDKTGLQHSVVYRALRSLSEKGLINHIMQGKRRIYQSTEPEHLLDYVEDKKKKLSEILPTLKARQIHQRKQSATIYAGTRGVTEVYTIMVNSGGDEYLTFGGGEECANRMGMSWWHNIHAKRLANKLSCRQVYDETVRPYAGKIEAQVLTKIKYVSEEFASFQETVIVGDKVAINVFTPNPYSFLIEDKYVAESYRKHFELLWKMGKD